MSYIQPRITSQTVHIVKYLVENPQATEIAGGLPNAFGNPLAIVASDVGTESAELRRMRLEDKQESLRMGNLTAKEINDWAVAPKQYKIEPNPRAGPSFDPMLGFPNGRKERDLICTKEDMENYQVPLKHRNYCAHYYIESRKCYLENNWGKRVFLGACKHAVHEWHNCLHEDRILMSKEYEREKRLLARQKRRIAAGLEEDPALAQANAEAL